LKRKIDLKRIEEKFISSEKVSGKSKLRRKDKIIYLIERKIV